MITISSFLLLISNLISSIHSETSISTLSQNKYYVDSDDYTANVFNKKICQSGLREDNTNYIYCARQNLTKIPNFFPNSNEYNSNSNLVFDELVLSDNLIKELRQDTFDSVLKVRKLYLDLNPIRYIDKRAFDRLRNYLEELYFEQKVDDTRPNTNEQLEVDYMLYDNHKEVDDLSKADDSILFEESILKSCFNLRILSIKNYFIRQLSDFKFQRFSKLEVLVLSKLKLKTIHDNAFAGLEQSLVELNLESNHLETVPTSSIEQLKRLKRLSLSQNRIKHLQSNAFFRFSSLNSLDLSYNYLSKIDEDAFNGPIQNSLKSIQLQNNELKWSHFIHLLYNLHLLQDLNIDFNKLYNNQPKLDFSILFKSSTEQRSHLKTSNINNSSIIYLKLNTLSMQGNSLTEQSLSMLMSLYDYDSLIEAKHSFDSISRQQVFRRANNLTPKKNLKTFHFSNLIKFNLARNKITKIPSRIFQTLNMTSLKTLVLDRNPLDAKKPNLNSDTFLGLEKSLQHLNLNNIGALSIWSKDLIDSLNALTSLQTLKLNSNKMNNFNGFDKANEEEVKLKLPSLTSLELQNNQLKDLPSFLCQLENLTDLDLSSNQLSRFNLDCLLFRSSININTGEFYDYSSTSLKHLNLNNNPLKCDCKMKQLRIWLMRNYDMDMLELIKWRCMEPFELSEKFINEISLSELVCNFKIDDLIKSSTITTSMTTTTSSASSSYLSNQPSLFLNQLLAQNETKSEMINSQEAEKLSLSSLDTNKILIDVERSDKKQHIATSGLYFGYYTLIISISFSISIFCLILLILFYFMCIRKQQYDKKKNSIVNDLSDFLLNFNSTVNTTASSNKTRNKTLSFISSPSGSTSTSTTSKNSDLIEIFSNDRLIINGCSNSNQNTINDDYNHLTNHPYYFHLDKSKQQQSKQHQHQQLINLNSSSDYNNLNYETTSSSLFSVETTYLNSNNSSGGSSNNDNHIYHEINTPMRVVQPKLVAHKYGNHFEESNLKYPASNHHFNNGYPHINQQHNFGFNLINSHSNINNSNNNRRQMGFNNTDFSSCSSSSGLIV